MLAIDERWLAEQLGKLRTLELRRLTTCKTKAQESEEQAEKQAPEKITPAEAAT